MNPDYKARLESRVAEILKDDHTGHDIHHSKRVYNYTRKIASGEGWLKDINDDDLYAASMLHDIGHLKCIREGDKLRMKHMEYGAQLAKGILRSLDMPKGEIELVMKCIYLHDDTKPWQIKNRTPTDVQEVLLIQDADNLEAMGVLGQIRVLLYSHDNGVALYNPTLSLTEKLEVSRNESAIHNMIWHLNLDDYFNTATAKVLAQKKKASAKKMIEDFLEEFNMLEE
ncbi:MAG: HD domain-containing protein [DPANN group archaeon]|nr:HD domain-containing protein [DPANN group archaeon]